jgi:NAD(P)-dependent dehydrogenase (short-subunit alcohol dehydrogenase family)
MSTTPTPQRTDAEWPEIEMFDGRVEMVTGGTPGIGAAICRRLAARGAEVAAGYGRDQDRAQQFQAELARRGTAATIHQGNVASAEDCRRTVSEVLEHHGRLDILVNNAGSPSTRQRSR